MAESPQTPESSRGRYAAYRERVRTRPAKETDSTSHGANGASQPILGPGHGHGDGKSIKRSRSFWSLVGAFLGLLRGHRATMTAALGTLAVSTLLALVPLYCTKLIFNNVLDTKPLPREVSAFPIPTEPHRLLG